MTRYFKRRKITKYLNAIDKNQYTVLDKMFQKYVNGDMERLFNEKGFEQIEIFATAKKNIKELQVYFKYGSLAGDVDFDDNFLDYVIYLPGISGEDYFRSIAHLDYTEDFTLERFIDMLLVKVNVDMNLKA